MPKRTCAACGNEKDVSGGKICEKGHFICSSCINKNVGIFSGAMKTCPLDETKLT